MGGFRGGFQAEKSKRQSGQELDSGRHSRPRLGALKVTHLHGG